MCEKGIVKLVPSAHGFWIYHLIGSSQIGVSLADMHIYVHWIGLSRIGVSLANICIYGSIRTYLLTLRPCIYHDVRSDYEVYRCTDFVLCA